MKKVMYEWCNSVQRGIQRTEECLGQASATAVASEIQRIMDELDVISDREAKILDATERMLKRNPGLTSHEYIYQKKEKKNTTRTNALIQLGNEMIFAGRQFGESSTYGKCLLIVGRCEEELGHEELRFVTQVAMVFLTPLKYFLETNLRTALKERRTLHGCRLDLDGSRHRLKKAKAAERQAAAEAYVRSAQAQFERQLELTKLACEQVQRDKVNQIRGLLKFVDSQLDHFNKSCAILDNVKTELLAVLKGEKGFDFEFQWPALNYDHFPITEEKATTQERGDALSVPNPELQASPTVQIRARIKYAFVGSTASEVTVLKDEIVTLLANSESSARESDGWSLIRKASGQMGYIPRDNTEVIEEGNDSTIYQVGRQESETSPSEETIKPPVPDLHEHGLGHQVTSATNVHN